jgi:hypothetical protein
VSPRGQRGNKPTPFDDAFEQILRAERTPPVHAFLDLGRELHEARLYDFIDEAIRGSEGERSRARGLLNAVTRHHDTRLDNATHARVDDEGHARRLLTEIEESGRWLHVRDELAVFARRAAEKVGVRQTAPAQPDAGLTEPPAAPQAAMRHDGASWVIRWGEEHGTFPVKDFGALDTVAKLVTVPNRPVELKDLVAADARSLLERPESAAEVLDNPTVAQARARYVELMRERDQVQHELLAGTGADPANEQRCREIDEELADIAAELKKAMGPGNGKRKLGRTPTDKAWDALTKRLSRLWSRLREAHMPNLASHLESAIHIDRPVLIYRPAADTPPWHVAE